jgi:hypothetical protein
MSFSTGALEDQVVPVELVEMASPADQVVPEATPTGIR